MFTSRFAKLLSLMAATGLPVAVTRRVSLGQRPARDPEQPAQAARIAAAQAKRERRGHKLHRDLHRSWVMGHHAALRLDPFFVNRG